MTKKALRNNLGWLMLVGWAIAMPAVPASAHSLPQPQAASSSSQKSGAAKNHSSSQSSASSQASHQGMVWVNPKTKIYHPKGDRWYGKSKGGKYMTEADALKAGYKPAKPRHPLPNAKKKKQSN
ncbi:MAG TPA: hypothetical protein VMX16_20070 [Terriglobia bacterium]|nr:hypothetical protein [Terriglobia bacterium]